MNRYLRLCLAALFAIASLLVAATGRADQGDLPLPVGGFIADGGDITTPGESGMAPSLTFGSTAPGGTVKPWLAFAEGGQGEPGAVLVSELTAQTWTRRGDPLNSQIARNANNPAIDFAGPGGSMPWTAFVEGSSALTAANQILVRRFTDNQWQLTGVPRGDSTAVALNRDPDRDANHPALASGAPGDAALPWVAWDEEAPAGTRQIFASRAVTTTDPDALGGIRWQMVGLPDVGGLLGLNVDKTRNGLEPDITMSGATSAEPWVVWYEAGGSVEKARRVFAARGVSDASPTTQGGFRWEVIGTEANCGADEVACTLNRNPDREAMSARVASGMLADEDVASPWVVYSEKSAASISQIYVARLDRGANPSDPGDDSFRPVGGSLNVSPGADAREPDIAFVGNVPHVVWSEDVGGLSRIVVKHLAVAVPGDERWDLDTGDAGLSRQDFQPAGRPVISSNGFTPYIAWEESGPLTNIAVAHRYPEGPAWGSNYPRYIRVISGDRVLARDLGHPEKKLSIQRGSTTAARPWANRLGPVTITTSCNHVNGWNNIREIHFMLRSRRQESSPAIFLAKYVATDAQGNAIHKVFVEDPDHPGTFLPGVTPGPGAIPISTKYVTLHVEQMEIRQPSTSSPVLDITWPLVFEAPSLLQDYEQSINIGYAKEPGRGLRAPDSEQMTVEFTGFFKVGELATVGGRTMLPIIRR